MPWLADFTLKVQHLLSAHGWVWPGIILLNMLLWILIFERWFYFKVPMQRDIAWCVQRWHQRQDRCSWYAQHIQTAWLAQLDRSQQRHMGLIKTLIAIAPLLGFLGTVTAMIEVFEALRWVDRAPAHWLAVSLPKATLPTLSALVMAMAGLCGYFGLQNILKDNQRRYRKAIVLSHQAVCDSVTAIQSK